MFLILNGKKLQLVESYQPFNECYWIHLKTFSHLSPQRLQKWFERSQDFISCGLNLSTKFRKNKEYDIFCVGKLSIIDDIYIKMYNNSNGLYSLKFTSAKDSRDFVIKLIKDYNKLAVFL